MQSWSPTSWQGFPYRQSASYPSAEALDKAVTTLSQLPPLVTAPEVVHLKSQLADAALGHAFLLQGGDCAESFDNCHAREIQNKLKILLQMSLILLHGLRKPIIRVGRIAGQYAKPRSSDFETQNGIKLPSYRGDIVNHPEFSAEKREPNPKLLLQGYSRAAMTLNYIRALVDGGFADLQHPQQWDLSFFQHASQAEEYHAIVNAIADSLDFLKTINGIQASSLHHVDFFTSHEALHLHYEQALTRQYNQQWYDLSTHFPWIGMRTAALDGAHIEYFRGIANPIGIKIGPNADPLWLKDLVETLNPDNEPGRLTLITRFGHQKVAEYLPKMISAVRETGKIVLWSCDPMHGNTETTDSGFKTRHFDNILSELQQSFDIHQASGSHLGGVHFELTGDDVTECIGGARGLEAEDLTRAYKSLVDPRLNYEQSIEMALQINRCMVNR